MNTFLQRFAGTLFYVLGLSFFLGYLFLRNDIGGPWPGWWMRVADLPLALAAVLYGGASFYRTIQRKEEFSWGKFLMVVIPLIIVFAAVIALNFWDALLLPSGSL